jgi:hypothetical protein
MLVRPVGQEATSEEGSPVFRQIPGDDALSETAVRKQRRRRTILKESVVTGSEMRMRQEVEGTLGPVQLRTGRLHGVELDTTDSIGEAQIGG